MLRKIIKIDQEKCDGCGICVNACHEGALAMIDNKATLTREDYCDGLGDCLPTCPQSAISFEEREALVYDEDAVLKNMKQQHKGCANEPSSFVQGSSSELYQWPVQIKLLPVQAPFYEHADLLIAADCSAYAFRDFHDMFMKHRITLIGCPKLDMVDYSNKLADIIRLNTIESIHVVRMEVPCCASLHTMVKQAIQKSGKELPCIIYVISKNGQIL